MQFGFIVFYDSAFEISSFNSIRSWFVYFYNIQFSHILVHPVHIHSSLVYLQFSAGLHKYKNAYAGPHTAVAPSGHRRNLLNLEI